MKSEVKYSYYSVNGVPYRLKDSDSIFELDAEEYKKGEGFTAGNLSLVLHEGTQLTEDEFKKFLVEYRNKK
jgi:hypothetical protein